MLRLFVFGEIEYLVWGGKEWKVFGGWSEICVWLEILVLIIYLVGEIGWNVFFGILGEDVSFLG